MKPLDAFTDFSSLALPETENDLSRRCLQVITRWVPVAMRYFNEWPGRPDCGHFFGGVLWYGQDTADPITTLALAASSPEFDAELAGHRADELRAVARKGLRYLLFTHDTGPEDCVRPEKSWGRTEPAGTKWGERGRGFFPESQCGRTIANLTLAAALTRDLIGDEEFEMLANVAADYMERFGDMAPKAGVYNNTQTEENAWTALGLTACMLLLPGHERLAEWQENAKLWMFRTTTTPQDTYDHSEFADGKTVADLCGRIYTTLPDMTAENHGFVHPSYMASALTLSGMGLNLLQLFGEPISPHIFWRRRECYDLLKSWCDGTGAPHCVQGMDWPYFAYPVQALFHALANVHLDDPDAALLELRSLSVVEKSSVAHSGRMVPEETVEHCHGQQDPSLMRERMISSLAEAYLAHRLNGEGPAPSAEQDFERRIQGVQVYPHGGALLHRHERGLTSLSWRNRTMVMPSTREGSKLIGGAGGSMLAQIAVRGRASRTDLVELKIRESQDRVCVLLEEHLAQASVRRRVFFASLPSGKCVIFERLTALDDITVENVKQGYLSVINDGYFGDHPDLRGRRTVYWEDGDRTFVGYAGDTDDEDEVLDLSRTGWVNVDDRFGVVFRGTGAAHYCNRHHFRVWHATEDDLVLCGQDEPQDHGAGDTISELTALWCPEQSPDETREERLVVHDTPADVFAAEADSFLCACNFSDDRAELPVEIAVPVGESFPVSWGIAGAADSELKARIALQPKEPLIVEMP